ncbi:hypothetical protein WR164_04710 [Philodulcilactobacillus myokoensis]|uniref:DUF7671 domain-containing protein n=1 Tax=Philodulcilactobacillus myokoensis TaxID=2929573 RepID=A0A9W6ESH6_9LACO|nr:hypothetical protein [Philodulcilactobacillus myokoensis]GLB46492.1 hypothetical protein WR164_04710 [Philodulcilactobacillus myokoensis]
MKGKYKVNRYIGLPVETDRSGNYVIKKDQKGNFKFHQWRTGKHTKGHFKGVGQIFLTENNLMVAVIDYAPVRFNHRHEYTPLQRFTSAFLTQDQYDRTKKVLKSKRK